MPGSANRRNKRFTRSTAAAAARIAELDDLMDIIEDDGLENPEIPDLSEFLRGSSAPPLQPSPTLPTPRAPGKWATPSTGKWAVRAASEPVGGP
ncbi:hypothetical protein BN14_10626 [Rhizoctonia solani AG-1 IB]|uniref:Uncharacterized protein n=1 Tax=Thanatephorus cucumeris (strain AG1-IB / isolate 7/3/14) TaxID=1108050 RepID=M5CBL8_THACB|nr:hypothetical protein BN14_10626 [Rhizoctonia solani AG-1 IB]